MRELQHTLGRLASRQPAATNASSARVAASACVVTTPLWASFSCASTALLSTEAKQTRDVNRAIRRHHAARVRGDLAYVRDGGIRSGRKSVESLLDLPRLHSSHSAWRLSSSFVPPFERGTMWSTCNGRSLV